MQQNKQKGVNVGVEAIGMNDSRASHELEWMETRDANKVTTPEMAHQRESVSFQTLLKSACIEQHFIDGIHSLGDEPIDVPPFVSQLNTAVMVRSFNEPAKAIDRPVIKPEQYVVSESVDDFVKSIWPYALHASQLLGLDPKVLMAQAALETGWGKGIAKDELGNSSNNLFNIKASSKQLEQSVPIKTTEYIADTPMTMVASFKKYASIEHSFNDYVSLIKNNNRYQDALSSAHDPERYIKAIHQAGYATDPQYATKLWSLFQGNQLQQALKRNGIL